MVTSTTATSIIYILAWIGMIAQPNINSSTGIPVLKRMLQCKTMLSTVTFPHFSMAVCVNKREKYVEPAPRTNWKTEKKTTERSSRAKHPAIA